MESNLFVLALGLFPGIVMIPPEASMTPASEQELALSMMRLWGKGAKHRARDYALDCWRKGDAPAYNRWHCVERIVEQAQGSPVPYAGTISGLPDCYDAGGDGSKVRFESVMLAIRRLGSNAIRGAGL